MNVNFQAAWVAILIGLISGTGLGMFFHKEDWLGGYSSWKRRMLRLGHISFFGLGFINLAFADSVAYLKASDTDIIWSSRLLLIGLISMPTVCFLSAIKKECRNLFFIPVGSLLAGVGIFVYQILCK